jgi:hypothetical protein
LGSVTAMAPMLWRIRSLALRAMTIEARSPI